MTTTHDPTSQPKGIKLPVLGAPLPSLQGCRLRLQDHGSEHANMVPVAEMRGNDGFTLLLRHPPSKLLQKLVSVDKPPGLRMTPGKFRGG